MKRILAVILAAVMVMGLATAVFADDKTLDGDAGTTNVTYTTEEAYTVTIPADITLTSSKLSATGNVKVTNALLGSGETLKITVASSNGYNLVNGDSKIAYTVKKGETTITADANEVISVEAGVKITDTNSAALTFATTEANIKAATAAGAHKDTLTFTVSVK